MIRSHTGILLSSLIILSFGCITPKLSEDDIAIRNVLMEIQSKPSGHKTYNKPAKTYNEFSYANIRSQDRINETINFKELPVRKPIDSYSIGLREKNWWLSSEPSEISLQIDHQSISRIMRKSNNKENIKLFHQTFAVVQQNKPKNKQLIKRALDKIICDPKSFRLHTIPVDGWRSDPSVKGLKLKIEVEFKNSADIRSIALTRTGNIELTTLDNSITQCSTTKGDELTSVLDSAIKSVNKTDKEKEEEKRKIKEEKRLAREKELAREREAKLARERKKWIVRAENERLTKEKEKAKLERIDLACKKAGYEGYCEATIPSTISTTQQQGGLEEFLNWVIDYPTGELYTQIKAISILDDAVLYSYSGPDMQFVIHVEKEPNKIYQEGQTLKKNFYVFTGMYTYISTSGAKKSVPSFKLANIEL